MKINTAKNNRAILNNNDMNRRVFFIVLSLFGIVAGLYVYFLGTIVFGVLERRTVATEAQTMRQEVNDLQIRYLSLNNSINLGLASSLGFTEAKGALFASSTDSSRSVSLR
jgi:hypothetical protein